MPRPCSLCVHSDRPQIDESIVAGARYRDVARQFGVSKDAVSRHMAHIAPALVEARQAGEVAQADDLLGDIRDLKADLKQARKEALEAGKYNSLALLANSEMRAYELLAKIYETLNGRSNSDVLANPLWREMRERVVDAFRDDPGGLAKLLGALAESEVEHVA